MRLHRYSIAVTLLLVHALCATRANAAQWIDDTNGNRIDDRIEQVDTHGLAAAYVNSDPTQRMRIGVFAGVPIAFAIYVGYDHHPTAGDVATLSSVGVPFTHPYLYIDYVRTQATYLQIQSIANLPGVTRVEAIPMMYATNHYGARVVRARDSRGVGKAQNEVLFPSARKDLGLDGTGIVVGILDTGVNDAPDSINAGYPGHESVAGKFLGGGSFYAGDPALNTPLTSSFNPQDHSGGSDFYHATHVAGTSIGTGGPGGFFGGVAPAARLVDCKVLSDAGAGFGAADGVEWCIYHRNTLWPGLSGADTIYRGIDVLNLSLGGTSNSDGTDASAQMMNAAVRNGIVVCIATGNDDSMNYIASPASADSSIAVGAESHLKTLDRGDDTVTSFSNEGPRRDDGDLEHIDEMKPSIVAPGDAIISANGDFTTDGTQYQTLSGTSMATPHTAGVCALVLQANPALTPMQMRSILQNTAEHRMPSVKGPFRTYPQSTDPNYDPGSGWGLIDAYAAAKEALDSSTGVQVVQFRPIARADSGRVYLRWVTQREHPSLGFDLYRAPDVNGSPGAFAKINSTRVPPVGHANIEGVGNRTRYVYADEDPGLSPGNAYWYRVAWVDLGSATHFEPAAPVEYGNLPRVATLYYSIAHNAADHDLVIRVGTSASYNPGAPQFVAFGPSEASQDSVRVTFPGPANTGSSTPGNAEHFWSVGLVAMDNVAGYLPPRPGQPWFLSVAEAGYVNRFGRITSFSMFVNDALGSSTGTTYATADPLPQPTAETTETTVWLPRAYSPLSVAYAQMAASEEANGVRLSLDFVDDHSGAAASVWRSTSSDFSSRAALTRQDIPVSGRAFSYLDGSAESGVVYFYWIQVREASGVAVWNGPVSGQLAGHLTFAAAPAPNPVHGSTRFAYSIGTDAARSGPVEVSLRLRDVQGRLIRNLARTRQGIGQYSVKWNAEDDQGRHVAPGIYYLQLSAGSRQHTVRVAVVN